MQKYRKSALFWLHISLRFQAIVSTLVLIPMLSQKFGALIPGFGNINNSADYDYAIRIAASIMVSSPILCLWADQQPLQRKDVLLILCIPAIGFVFANYYAAFINPIITVNEMILHWFIDFFIIALHIFTYTKAYLLTTKDKSN